MNRFRGHLESETGSLLKADHIEASAEQSAAATAPARRLVSLIVAVRNAQTTLAGTLDGLLLQEDPRNDLEILVVDGGSTDATAAIAAAYAQRDSRVRALSNPRRWASAGRNVGLAACRGDIVAVVDGHTEVQDRQFLSRLVELFEGTGAECIGFPQPLISAVDNPVQRAIAAARASALGRHPASVTYSQVPGFVSPHPAAVAYRRSVLDDVGGFDESFDACEDLELSYRIAQRGFRCYYTAQLSTPYHARRSLRQLFHQQWRYGRGRVRLLRRHPGTFAIATFLPALLVLCAVTVLPFVPFSRTLAALYLSAVAVYFAAILVQAICLARDHGWQLLPWLVAAFTTIHLGAGIGSLYELVSPPARRRLQTYDEATVGRS